MSLIPNGIEYIFNDSCFSFWPDCYFRKDIIDTGENIEESGINTPIPQNNIPKYAIKPFVINMNMNCQHRRIYYFDDKGDLWHYNVDDAPDEYGGINNPVKGLYGYKKEFKYWNDFYDLGRMN
jgi:hypothetical protein